MATPNHGWSSRARRRAATESSRSSATASDERTSGGAAATVVMQVVSLPWAAPTLARMEVRSVRWAHASSSWRTRAGARGSAKVAVPTWTARGSGEDQLGGVSSRGDAADPDDRQVRQRACTSWTARTAIGWMAGPERPPPRAPDPSR